MALNDPILPDVKLVGEHISYGPGIPQLAFLRGAQTTTFRHLHSVASSSRSPSLSRMRTISLMPEIVDTHQSICQNFKLEA